MDFGSGGNMDAKAWKDIWGAGQGIATINATLPTSALVARLRAEYDTALAGLVASASISGPAE